MSLNSRHDLIKGLQTTLPRGTPFDLDTLQKHGVSPQLAAKYVKSGWLDSFHTFSFGSYYQADRVHFGALRVLNDDTVAGGMGFGVHPHDNMEIISIPTSGDLEHQDSMGNTQVIRQGDVQVMSAGTGIQHSEKNKNQDQPVEFFQIWVIPNQK